MVASLALATMVACSGGAGAPPVDIDELLSTDALGGGVTARAVTVNAFGLPAPDLSRDERRVFELGDSFFTQPWVQAPSSTEARDGLGPLFNANACAACHVRDGRAAPPVEDEVAQPGLLLRLSVAAADGTVGDHPDYGGQLQDHALPLLGAEGTVMIQRERVTGTYPDGTTWELERPTYAVVDAIAGAVDDDVLVSPRIAPQMVGVGLLEAIPEDAIRAAADPDDADGDGISGRVNEVASPSLGGTAVGRFGWKANVATVADQVAGAFLGDLGITSSLHPDEDCTAVATGCADAQTGGAPEIDDDRLGHVVFYSSVLAVPAMRDVADAEVVEGARAFVAAGCATCHTPIQTTGAHEISVLADQEIRPYTDLLLHDMGPGLADGRPDGLATGTEWRTPPLWGIGLVEAINGHTRYLHDGRARDLEEAILWHGGEADSAREAFMALAAADRAALVRFLTSL